MTPAEAVEAQVSAELLERRLARDRAIGRASQSSIYIVAVGTVIAIIVSAVLVRLNAGT
jgi:hypothetical protein